MVKLHFKTTEEFEKLFKKNSKEITDHMVSGIEKAVMDNKKTAKIFEITFDDNDMLYEISLPQSQWQEALSKCLDHYRKLNLTDEQIDTWKLLEAVKVW